MVRFIAKQLDYRLNKATTTILAEVTAHQQRLAETVEDHFQSSATEARWVLKKAFQKELSKGAVATTPTDVLLDKLLDLVAETIRGMGDYQQRVVANQTASSLKALETHIKQAHQEVAHEIQHLKSTTGPTHRPSSTSSRPGSATLQSEPPRKPKCNGDDEFYSAEDLTRLQQFIEQL